MAIIDRDRRRRIYLVGFMGAGKTSVGECLARELRFRFVDLDREIEREAGRTIAELFRDDGEEVFRRLEARALRLVDAPGVVVGTGGGTLTLWENRDFIHRTGISIWLDAPLDVMLERCRASEHRPLLSDRPRMEALLADRLPAYRAADLRVDASADLPDALAARIVSTLAGLR
ncbi:MAG: shikimate kinase [Acidobacteria bacterium]|nr:shikimate kinase [Acidobacteriota bacterium]